MIGAIYVSVCIAACGFREKNSCVLSEVFGSCKAFQIILMRAEFHQAIIDRTVEDFRQFDTQLVMVEKNLALLEFVRRFILSQQFAMRL